MKGSIFMDVVVIQAIIWVWQSCDTAWASRVVGPSLVCRAVNVSLWLYVYGQIPTSLRARLHLAWDNVVSIITLSIRLPLHGTCENTGEMFTGRKSISVPR